MSRIISIDLGKDSRIDASIEELELLRDILNDSIRIKRKEEKRKKPVQSVLFDVPIKVEVLKTFRESEAFKKETFDLELLSEKELGVNLDYYYCAVLDWSDMNPKKKRTKTGWTATARSFMRSDNEAKKLKMLNDKKDVSITNETIDYLKM